MYKYNFESSLLIEYIIGLEKIIFMTSVVEFIFSSLKYANSLVVLLRFTPVINALFAIKRVCRFVEYIGL